MTVSTIDITVRFSGMTYLTSKANGKSASCTMSAEHAAKALGRKLYGNGFTTATQLPGGMHNGPTLWRLEGTIQ